MSTTNTAHGDDDRRDAVTDHGWTVRRESAPAVPKQLLLAAAAAGATVLGLLVLLVGGVVVAVGLGALVLIGAAVVVHEIERSAR